MGPIDLQKSLHWTVFESLSTLHPLSSSHNVAGVLVLVMLNTTLTCCDQDTTRDPTEGCRVVQQVQRSNYNAVQCSNYSAVQSLVQEEVVSPT